MHQRVFMIAVIHLIQLIHSDKHAVLAFKGIDSVVPSDAAHIKEHTAGMLSGSLIHLDEYTRLTALS